MEPNLDTAYFCIWQKAFVISKHIYEKKKYQENMIFIPLLVKSILESVAALFAP